MITHPLRLACDQAVVETLVVAVVKALLHQRPLEVPVRLGDVPQARRARHHRGPVLVGRPRPRFRPPRPLKDVVRHQHRHVAPHGVAVLPDGGQRGCRGLTQPGVERVQLKDVRPWREIGVSAESDGTGLRVVDEELRMLSDPRVVGGYVVGNEVEDEGDAPVGKRAASSVQPVPSSQPAIRDVPAHAVRRPDDVLLRIELRQVGPPVVEEPLLPAGDVPARWAAFPHAHEPDGVDAQCRDPVPGAGGHGGEGGPQVAQPRPRVDLEDAGLVGERGHRASISRLAGEPELGWEAPGLAGRRLAPRPPRAPRVGGHPEHLN